jgi:hypothetical protein
MKNSKKHYQPPRGISQENRRREINPPQRKRAFLGLAGRLDL